MLQQFLLKYLKNVHEFQNIFWWNLIFPPFWFNGHIHLGLHGPDVSTMLLGFLCLHKCSAGVEVRWLWRRVHDSQDSLVFKRFLQSFRVYFMVQYEWCFPLVRMESILCSKIRQNTPRLGYTTMFYCGFEPLWYHSLSCSSPYIHPSAINLKLGFNNEEDFSFPIGSVWPCFISQRGFLSRETKLDESILWWCGHFGSAWLCFRYNWSSFCKAFWMQLQQDLITSNHCLLLRKAPLASNSNFNFWQFDLLSCFTWGSSLSVLCVFSLNKTTITAKRSKQLHHDQLT